MFDRVFSYFKTSHFYAENSISKSIHQRCSMKKCSKGKHLCQSTSLNKVAGFRPATILKKRLWNRFFPVNFAKFLRIPLLQNTSGQLLLYFGKTSFVSRYLSLAPGGKFQKLYVHIHQTIINYLKSVIAQMFQQVVSYN